MRPIRKQGMPAGMRAGGLSGWTGAAEPAAGTSWNGDQALRDRVNVRGPHTAIMIPATTAVSMPVTRAS